MTNNTYKAGIAHYVYAMCIAPLCGVMTCKSCEQDIRNVRDVPQMFGVVA